jgi:tRNA U34 5-methylaminomethyl-2-thiouridine-forming methyltransferase MnmC
MCERKIIVTKDGTTTIALTNKNEFYHSKHGAISEAMHVYIKNGLEFKKSTHKRNTLKVLEVGFGTGLNSLLTLLATINSSTNIHYTGIEAFPVSKTELDQLNYHVQLGIKKNQFLRLHQTSWNDWCKISNHFQLFKWEIKLEDAVFKDSFDLIYFDAFGYRTQPEIWHFSMLEKICAHMKKGGVFVTYAAMGQVRRDLISCGLEVKKLEGPPGKREMLRGIKKN